MDRTKGALVTALCTVCLLVCLSGCTKEVDRTPLDTRFTAAHETVETAYNHKYSVLRGEFVLVPNVRTVRHPEEYEVLYLVTYDNGGTSEVWEQVTKEVYDAVRKEMERDG